MARTKEQNERMREKTREKIIYAAIALFAEKGLVATSVQDIAKRAGVSVGLMYHYYKTKDDVFHELVKQALESIDELKKMIDNHECPCTILNLIADDIVKDLESGYELSQWIMMLPQYFMANDKTNCNHGVLDFHKRFICEISNLIKKGQSSGKFKDGDPDKMAYLFMSIIIGVCSLQLSVKEDFKVPTKEMLIGYIIK